MKLDAVLMIVAMTFLIYSIFGGGVDATLFRFIIGSELAIGVLYCMISPINKWR
jgi:predicted Na+-dependent transporter